MFLHLLLLLLELLAAAAAAGRKNKPAAAAQPTRESAELNIITDNGDDSYTCCLLRHQVAYASKLVKESPAKIQQR